MLLVCLFVCWRVFETLAFSSRSQSNPQVLESELKTTRPAGEIMTIDTKRFGKVLVSINQSSLKPICEGFYPEDVIIKLEGILCAQNLKKIIDQGEMVFGMKGFILTHHIEQNGSVFKIILVLKPSTENEVLGIVHIVIDPTEILEETMSKPPEMERGHGNFSEEGATMVTNFTLFGAL